MRIRPFLHAGLLALITFLSGCDTGRPPKHSLEVAVKGVHGAALADDGSMAIIGSIYHGGSLWRLADRERIYNWNHNPSDTTTIVAADFSSDGFWGLTADPSTLVLWNTKTGEGFRYWNAPGEILDAELGPGARTALLGLSDHTAVLFDILRGGIKQTLRHGNRVRSVDLSEDGAWALTGSEDYTATFWNLSNGKAVTQIKHNDEVRLVKLSADSSIVLSVSKYDKALLWEARTGKVIAELALTAQHLKRGLTFTSASFSRDNQFLLTGRPDQTVQLWKLPEATELARWRLPKRNAWKPTSAAVVAVGFGATPQQAFAISSNGFVHWLETASIISE